MEKIFKCSGWWMAALCCAALVVSCKDDDSVPPQLTENQKINTWILDSMEYYYYWNDEIPQNPRMDLDPEDFFESILSSKDRFSWMQKSADELSDNLNGKFKSFGYEVQLYYLKENSDEVGAVVLYTYEGSVAEIEGLKRGMWIGKVNGQALNDNNYEILFDTERAQELSVGNVDNEGNFIPGEDITVQPAEIQENPVYLDSIYVYAGKKIGYVVYNSFIPAPADDESGVAVYDDALKDIFSRFKAQGVNELILDLRYNLGGDVSSAFKLGGYIMKGYQPGNIFAIYEDNTREKYPFPVSLFYENESPPNLSLDRVHVLISSRAASASELIINGLKPYMEVILTGDTNTVGKNVASQTIYDQRNIPENQKIKYGLQPIVLKIYNSQGESDFEEGFAPDPGLQVFENYKAFGDVSESFLHQVLNSITGGEVLASTEALRVAKPSYGRMIGSSLDRKPGAGQMYVKPGEMPVMK